MSRAELINIIYSPDPPCQLQIIDIVNSKCIKLTVLDGTYWGEKHETVS